MKIAVIVIMVLAGAVLLPTPLKLIVTIVDFIIPDPIPFADEIVLIVSILIKMFIDEEKKSGINVLCIIILLIGAGLLIFYF